MPYACSCMPTVAGIGPPLDDIFTNTRAHNVSDLGTRRHTEHKSLSAFFLPLGFATGGYRSLATTSPNTETQRNHMSPFLHNPIPRAQHPIPRFSPVNYVVQPLWAPHGCGVATVPGAAAAISSRPYPNQSVCSCRCMGPVWSAQM